jgi:hypothetical protein
MKRLTKYANTLPREHRNTPWAEFSPPAFGPRREGVIVAVVCLITAVAVALLVIR